MNGSEAAEILNRAQMIHSAREIGEEHARNAASWAADGNADAEERRRVLKMLDEGDPAAWDYLPKTPNLSGEFADDPTPTSLFWDVAGPGAEEPAPELVDALADAYMDAVSETFGPACEAVLIEHYGDVR